MKYVLVCRYLSTISRSQVSTQECIRSKSSSWYRLAVPSKSTKSTFRKSSSFVYSKPDDFIQCYNICSSSECGVLYERNYFANYN